MPDNDKDLTADEVRRLLRKLDDELALRGHSVTVYVVGGVNMALAVDNSRTTKDIDVVVKRGFAHLAEAARAVATTEPGLSEDWINTEFTGGDNPTGGLTWQWFDNRDDDVPLAFYRGSALTVEGASNEMMLALKTLAHRDQDVSDTFALMRKLGIRTPLDLGRNLARFTGPRIFQAQGSSGLHPEINPLFPHIFDNAPDDLRPEPEPRAKWGWFGGRRNRPRCDVVSEIVRAGVVVERLACRKPLGHSGSHRFRPHPGT